MIYRNNGGPSLHVAAANLRTKHPYYTATLTYSEAQYQLKALGFKYLDSLPAFGRGRIAARGKAASNRSAAVIWTLDSQALHWHEYTTGIGGTIFSKRPKIHDGLESVSLLYRAAKQRREMEAKATAGRIAAQSRGKQLARAKWAVSLSNSTHSYIESKQLTGLHNARIDSRSGALLIPMWVPGSGLVNLQRIYFNGTKRFLKGARVSESYSVIGSLHNAERVFVCEGWATGATLYEKYRLPAVVAFTAGNLMAVCQSLRTRFQAIEIIVAGDDDSQSAFNTGREKARHAAESVGATLLLPEFCKACSCTDHNDVMVCARRRYRG